MMIAFRSDRNLQRWSDAKLHVKLMSVGLVHVQTVDVKRGMNVMLQFRVCCRSRRRSKARE